MVADDKRRGMGIKDHSSYTIKVDKEMMDNPKSMYRIKATVHFGKKEKKSEVFDTVYSFNQHDAGINYILNKLGFSTKSFEMLEIRMIKKVGNSVATTKEIKKWKI